jgi:hypothetical protein
LFPTSAGNLSITFLGHASLLMTFNGKNIFVDPFGQVADYSSLPKADLILCTHEHRDHLDPQALAAIRTPATCWCSTQPEPPRSMVVLLCATEINKQLAGLPIEAVPAYNILHKREDGNLFIRKATGTAIS